MWRKATDVITGALRSPRDVPADEVSRRILDAILPQVTTVEELEALPDSALLVTDDGYVLQHFADQYSGVILPAFGTPLTVVWQP
jgi:hypothetical protein